MTGTKTDRLVILLSGKPHIEKDKLMQDFIPMCENVDEQQALFQVVEQYRNKQSEEKNT